MYGSLFYCALSGLGDSDMPVTQGVALGCPMDGLSGHNGFTDLACATRRGEWHTAYPHSTNGRLAAAALGDHAVE